MSFCKEYRIYTVVPAAISNRYYSAGVATVRPVAMGSSDIPPGEANVLRVQGLHADGVRSCGR